ncbi:MAG: hypothetical protein IPJ94_19500 [Chloroflexi bacterium]|nr:hypothetical protein [Chloroflexota bacterium]
MMVAPITAAAFLLALSEAEPDKQIEHLQKCIASAEKRARYSERAYCIDGRGQTLAAKFGSTIQKAVFQPGLCFNAYNLLSQNESRANNPTTIRKINSFHGGGPNTNCTYLLRVSGVVVRKGMPTTESDQQSDHPQISVNFLKEDSTADQNFCFYAIPS